MAAFEAVLSFGLALAYIVAGPVLRVLAPQSLYRVGAAGAAIATVLLFPLLALRHESATEDETDQDALPGPADVARERAMVDATVFPPAV
jgi:hypothetical protein